MPSFITFVGRVPLLGEAMRWYAGRYPENSVVEIAHGRAAGLLWRRHHRYVNGYWIGHYESLIQNALKRELKTGDTFFDLGANAGFFTLVAARLVGSRGNCVAFEPSRVNCDSIQEQLELNSLCPCQVVNAAISDFIGSGLLSYTAPGSTTAHLGENGSGERQTRVDIITLDEACTRFGRPDFIKMDIEGAEVSALRGATHTLGNLRPSLLIELHGPECECKVNLRLQAAGYAFFDLQGGTLNPNRSLPTHFIARPSSREEA